MVTCGFLPPRWLIAGGIVTSGESLKRWDLVCSINSKSPNQKPSTDPRQRILDSFSNNSSGSQEDMSFNVNPCLPCVSSAVICRGKILEAKVCPSNLMDCGYTAPREGTINIYGQQRLRLTNIQG